MVGFRNFFIQISHTILSNIVRLLVVGLLTLIVPRFISVENYGYWQLYIFYTSYVGFFHLGWCDGVYLKEGGKEYNSINKPSYKTQFIYLAIMQVIFSSIIIMLFLSSINNTEKMFIIIGTCLNAIVSVPCTLLSYIMQSTGKIKEFSYITIIGRIIYLLLTIFFIAFKFYDYKLIILADLIGWGASLLYSILICKDIFFVKRAKGKLIFKEIVNNISVGSKLMIANIASTLIIGIVRLNIESNWSIELFGKISLSLNLCNLILIFINAISIVLYPMLRRSKTTSLKKLYEILDNLLIYILILALALYFPIRLFIIYWLPQYEVSIYYMAILFPICIYESKISLLIYTFLKVLREEKKIMNINIIILMMSCGFSYITTYLMKNIDLTIYLILILLIVRCLILEHVIHRSLNICNNRTLILELTYTFIFIIICNFVNVIFGFLLYLCICFSVVVLYKRNIIENFRNLKTIFLEKNKEG